MNRKYMNIIYTYTAKYVLILLFIEFEYEKNEIFKL